MTKYVVSIVAFILLASSQLEQQVASYSPAAGLGRRDLFHGLVSGVAASTLLVSGPQEARAVISSKYCAYGTGDGCEDLAEGNEFIKELQAKSASNKEAIQREAKNAYYMKNYPDFFASIGKTMVKKPDGTFMLVSDAELEQLKKENKIGVEIPKTMGGKFTDLTQKPITILKDE